MASAMKAAQIGGSGGKMRRKDREVSDIKAITDTLDLFFGEGEPVQTEIPCNCGYYFSSIIGNGTAQFIEEPDEKRYALGKMFEHQTGKKAEFTRAQANLAAGREEMQSIWPVTALRWKLLIRRRWP